MAENPVERTLAKQIVDLAGQVAGLKEQLDNIQIRAIEILSPQAGDVLLITVPDHLSDAQRASIARGFREHYQNPDVKIAVLRDSMAVKILRPENPKEEDHAGTGPTPE